MAYMLTPTDTSPAANATEIENALTTYGEVCLTPGTWDVDTINMPDNCKLTGKGATLRRDIVTYDNTIMIDATGGDNITIADIKIDLQVNRNDVTAIKISTGTHILIDATRIYSSIAPDPSWTSGNSWEPLAILAKQVTDVVIRNNTVINCQIKCNGGSKRVHIVGNHSIDAHNSGISVVTVTSGDTFEDIIIDGNIIQGAWASGIYTGADGDSAGGVSRRLSITNNTVIFNTRCYAQWLGIYHRFATTTEDFTCANNRVVSIDTSDNSRGKFGIRLKRTDTGSGKVERAVVTGNTAYGADSKDIDVLVADCQMVVSNNVVSGGQGFSVDASGEDQELRAWHNLSQPRNASTPVSVTTVDPVGDASGALPGWYTSKSASKADFDVVTEAELRSVLKHIGADSDKS